MNILELINRKDELFDEDLSQLNTDLGNTVSRSKFLVLGGAGSIGQAVVREIFSRDPLKLHVVDISENNLSELVRDLRSTIGYINGDFQTFALDIGSKIYDKFFEDDGDYDYILNLSALKHVRSEKDAYTLMRMIQVNVLNTNKTIKQSIRKGIKKYFCVSTDKATNPVNMMGASKRIMELYLTQFESDISISTARFANVAFSDGSLLHSFRMRVEKKQPIVAPTDVLRYFITPREAGQLCLLSCIYGRSNEIYFPNSHNDLKLTSFARIAENFLQSIGKVPLRCETEDEARKLCEIKTLEDYWPCFWTQSDTTGEKHYEEFYTDQEEPDFSRYRSIGIVMNRTEINLNELINAEKKLVAFAESEMNLTKSHIVSIFRSLLPTLSYDDVGRYLDGKM